MFSNKTKIYSSINWTISTCLHIGLWYSITSWL